MPEAEYTPPTLNIYHTYMSLPFDETKRTWQKMAHTPTTASPKSRGEESGGDKETATSRDPRPKPPEKA